MASSKEILETAKMFELLHRMLDGLEIVTEKKVEVHHLFSCKKVAKNDKQALELYNQWVPQEDALTQEEYKLLKDVLFEAPKLMEQHIKPLTQEEYNLLKEIGL